MKVASKTGNYPTTEPDAHKHIILEADIKPKIPPAHNQASHCKKN